MDNLSRELNTFLVSLGMNPEATGHDMEHKMEHLLHLLQPDDEQAIVDYYGLFGTPRRSLAELASDHGLKEEDMMAAIDICVRRLAVTPEWQQMKTEAK